MSNIVSPVKNLQANQIDAICRNALLLDYKMAAFGASLLSKEGLIFCNAVINHDQILKSVTYSERCSLRAANLAVDKFVKVGLFNKRPSNFDKRSVLITVNYKLLDTVSASPVTVSVNAQNVVSLAMA